MSASSDESAVVTLVDRVLLRAVKDGASDVHIEPREARVRVRFRIDGLLVDRPAVPVSFASAVVSRLKVMARLDIAERRLPQDGAFRLEIEGRAIDTRLSTFPTEHGEKVVLRILARSEVSLRLDGLGMPGPMYERVKYLANRAHGLILVTGPTGSGKTSTLYALLSEIDATRKNICTLEDPIEYRFQHVIQGQTHEKMGFTFARGLRAMLRQDPDVIMVGEMRDAETATIAFKAALTGHMVLSSLHTNSAIETFVRLFDMGLERYVVASALSAMIGQRLVRRLCLACRRPHAPDAGMAELIAKTGEPPIAEVYSEVGCVACNHTGFRGRMGIYELVEVDDDLRDLVKSETTTRVALRDYMTARHLHGLRATGLALVRQGITSVAEVVRVT